jgi:hypothetical protein
MVNYDLSSSSSVSVKTSEDSGVTRSVLTITEAKPDNAGNYTCKPSNAIAASIQVFVSEGTKKNKCPHLKNACGYYNFLNFKRALNSGVHRFF